MTLMIQGHFTCLLAILDDCDLPSSVTIHQSGESQLICPKSSVTPLQQCQRQQEFIAG